MHYKTFKLLNNIYLFILKYVCSIENIFKSSIQILYILKKLALSYTFKLQIKISKIKIYNLKTFRL